MIKNQVRFDVEGLPATQGSKSHVGKGRMVDSCKRLPEWRQLVALSARSAKQKSAFRWPALGAVEPGQPVCLGIRPHDLEPSETGALSLRAELVETLGPDAHVHGHVGGLPFSV